MARSMPLVAALLLVSAAVLAVAPRTAEALACGNVVAYLAPCIPYARGVAKAPTMPCCNGVRNLNAAVKSKADRQMVCTCLKSTVASVSGINFNNVSGIPGKCGVTVPYPISTSVDCSKVE
ncbi:non-specific lipid-transfer protein 1-like [Zingiber officinale]|uniref:Bifunctional inhibitor/plant lipid transfer protein/seed storage helical domain-containing protein n=1 Tax=Nesterenkonia sphaerica TaxID=1804988 RepID=A0A5R8ZUA5_9MICC|nr:non-specific lipid-transfer protein 1-like [Zingiber officinale]TLP69860.1 hypothetical protein FEF27_13185 [Nesterenkonia sphaerica]